VTGKTLALAVLGEPLLVTAGELGDVRQPIYRARRHHFLHATDVTNVQIITRMWADAQRDGRPTEYSWRLLFNAAKFG